MHAVLIIVAVAAAAAVLFGAIAAWDVFVPKRCGGCGKRGLKCINFVHVTPGPNYATFRCPHCRAEFVQVHGRLEPRRGSKWEYEDGW